MSSDKEILKTPGALGSELRLDLTTREWVLISPERAFRPQEAARAAEYDAGLAYDGACPFCRGNEAQTPPDIYRINDTNGWQVRVVPNKFPAVRPEVEFTTNGGFFRQISGVGHHEVIIESPLHNVDLPEMREPEVFAVLQAYQTRYRELSRARNVRFIVIFRNHGERAGTSLRHPHSQLLATPVLPAYMRLKHEVAAAYFRRHRRCVYEDIRTHELEAGTRIVESTPGFVAFCPFASGMPFEISIFPMRCSGSFGDASGDELEALAALLRRTLRRLKSCCDDLDYNYVIHSCAVGDEQKPYYLWHLQIAPRLTQPAGFEIGSHMMINPLTPENAAAKLRNANVPQAMECEVAATI